MKTGIILAIVMALIVCELTSQELFDSTEHFQFYRYDDRSYELYVSTFSQTYTELVNLLNLESNHLIKIMIFQDQRKFIEEVFGYYESGITSVGMAVKGEDTIYITSYYDETTGRNSDEYMRVAKHELVHTLMNHERSWLSEGLALFCAGQDRRFETLPASCQEMSEYLNHNYYFHKAYAYYYWFSTYLIEKVGFNTFLNFFRSEYNWEIVGYSNQEEFCRDAYYALISSPNSE